MNGTDLVFDAHTRVEDTSLTDLVNLRHFGVKALVTAAHDGYRGTKADDLLRHLDRLVHETTAKVRQAGITPHVAVGIHPRRIPWLGVDAILARLPDYFDRPEVVAIGEIGLHEGGEREETVFRHQIELARGLRIPMLVHVPAREHARMLKRTLTVLREESVPGHSALLLRLPAGSVSAVRELDYRVALGSLCAEDCAGVVGRLGPEGLLLASDLGDGPADPLVPARALAEMEKASLSKAVLRRVAFGNAVSFFGVDALGD